MCKDILVGVLSLVALLVSMFGCKVNSSNVSEIVESANGTSYLFKTVSVKDPTNANSSNNIDLVCMLYCSQTPNHENVYKVCNTDPMYVPASVFNSIISSDIVKKISSDREVSFQPVSQEDSSLLLSQFFAAFQPSEEKYGKASELCKVDPSRTPIIAQDSLTELDMAFDPDVLNSQSVQLTKAEFTVAKYINVLRKERGLKGIDLSPELSAYAQAAARDMADHDRLYHAIGDYRNSITFTFLGDVIAALPDGASIDIVMGSSMAKRSALANLLHKDAEVVGIGSAKRKGSSRTSYFDIVFGKRK